LGHVASGAGGRAEACAAANACTLGRVDYFQKEAGATMTTTQPPTLGAEEAEILKAVFRRRAMEAVSGIPDMMNRARALKVVLWQMGGALVEKFNVQDVLEIPLDQLAIAKDFLEAVPLNVFARPPGVH
jgi:hypothetical protein